MGFKKKPPIQEVTQFRPVLCDEGEQAVCSLFGIFGPL